MVDRLHARAINYLNTMKLKVVFNKIFTILNYYVVV